MPDCRPRTAPVLQPQSKRLWATGERAEARSKSPSRFDSGMQDKQQERRGDRVGMWALDSVEGDSCFLEKFLDSVEATTLFGSLRVCLLF